MADSCVLYYITNRQAFPGEESTRRRSLLDKIAEAANSGVDYIQLREKDLPGRELESLAREAMRIIQRANEQNAQNQQPETALLINSRADVALATKAHGVHIPSNDISLEEVRKIYSRGYGQLASELSPHISVSCHSPAEAIHAAAAGATLALFGPVFEKKDVPGAAPKGLTAVHQAACVNIPVFALGGITLENAASCVRAGAAGIAAIRLFQENDIATVVRALLHRS
ncbi:MAG TPA: thiamine phosphate synthase [Candidatus Aquilonibacter sp.]|jgi:thiamine-phosphate pyrophosphorylase|nr:thiamine phosphate synthase [Candidatus Aquilonibacter sp.]